MLDSIEPNSLLLISDFLKKVMLGSNPGPCAYRTSALPLSYHPPTPALINFRIMGLNLQCKYYQLF